MDAKAIDFVKYTVSDCETAIPFYRDALGLPLEKHLEDLGWAEFALRPTTLALEEAEDAVGAEGAPDGAAVAIAVEDIERAIEELRATDAEVQMDPIDTGACEMAQVKDPDGNPIVLHRRHDGTHGRKNPFQD